MKQALPGHRRSPITHTAMTKTHVDGEHLFTTDGFLQKANDSPDS